MLAVQGVGIGGLAFHREDDVVGDHGGVQPQALAFTRQSEDARARGGGAAGGDVETVAHRVGSVFLLEMPKSRSSVETFCEGGEFCGFADAFLMASPARGR